MSNPHLYLRSIPDPVLIFDQEGILCFQNESARHLLEGGSHADDQVIPEWISGILIEFVQTHTKSSTRTISRVIRGTEKYIEMVFNKVEETGEILLSIRDITRLRKSNDQLEYLTYHESQTGLYNDSYFQAETERLDQSRRQPVSVIFFRLEGMTAAQEVMDYSSSDEMIMASAGLLRACFRREDVCARIRGDLYGVLMPSTDTDVCQKAILRVLLAGDRYNQINPHAHLTLTSGSATAMKPGALQQAVLLAETRLIEAHNKAYPS
jgi:GGDEF domain-containing protein